MRFPRPTYSVRTNIFLTLGIVSAFGFDQTGHIAWLVLGGCAASGAIATYFAQHWKAKLPAESSAVPISPTNRLSGDSWVWQAQIHDTSRLWVLALTENQQDSYWRPEKPGTPDFWYSSHDSAELAVRIIKRLEATEKWKVDELVIARSGHITIRFKDDLEDAWTRDLPQLPDAQLHKPVNQFVLKF